MVEDRVDNLLDLIAQCLAFAPDFGCRDDVDLQQGLQ